MNADIKWDSRTNVYGTGFTGFYLDNLPWSFDEAVDRLSKLSGIDGRALSCDKTTVGFYGTFRGKTFTLYDYYGDGRFHIGAYGDSFSPNGTDGLLTDAEINELKDAILGDLVAGFEGAPLPKGLRVRIIRDTYYGDIDCTNDGVTSVRAGAKTALLVGEGLPELFTADRDEPVLKLVKRVFATGPYFHAEPVDKVPDGSVGWMAGGNFVWSSDSRFTRATAGYPVSVHDRSETTKESGRSSRAAQRRTAPAAHRS